MLHPEAALLGAVVENRDRLVDGIADDSGAVPSVVGLLETMAKEFRSRKLSGRGFLAFKVRGRQAREERAEREAQSAREHEAWLLQQRREAEEREERAARERAESEGREKFLTQLEAFRAQLPAGLDDRERESRAAQFARLYGRTVDGSLDTVSSLVVNSYVLSFYRKSSPCVRFGLSTAEVAGVGMSSRRRSRQVTFLGPGMFVLIHVW